MKKVLFSIIAIVFAAFTMVSCEDVPAPYDRPGEGGGNDPEVTAQGDGTAANPYNITAINEVAGQLEQGATSDKVYYFKGKVSQIKEISASFGNATFYLSDDGTTKNQFYVYRANGLNNQKVTDENFLKLGDEVVVCGKVTNYNGTLETLQKESYVVSVNGEGNPTTEPSGGETPTEGILTVAQAINAQGTNGATVKGYIVAALKYGVSSSNGDIADLELASPFTGYNAIFIADSPTETDPSKMLCAKLNDTESPADLKSKVNLKDNPSNLGKELTLTGNLKACYTGLNGIRGITAYELEGSNDNTTQTDIKTISIAEFNAAPESTIVWYQLTGTIKNLKDGDLYGNFDLEDETGSVYVYGVLSEKDGEKKHFQDLVSTYGLANGSSITIIGNRGSYNGKIEVMNAYFVKKN